MYIRYNKFFIAPNILELYILSHLMHTSTYGPDFERFLKVSKPVRRINVFHNITTHL